MKKLLCAICLFLILFLSCSDCIDEGELGCTEDSDCCQGLFDNVNCVPIQVDAWINCRGCEGTKESCDGTSKEWCRILGEDGICREVKWWY